MVREDIGQKAREVMALVAARGEVPLSTFEAELEGSRALVQAAVGWLAREGTISFRRDGRTTLVSASKPTR